MDTPSVPWDVVDRLLVYGERRADEKTGLDSIHYPSFSDLARRFDVSRTLIWRYAHQHRVLHRRAEIKLKTEARVEAKVIEKLSDARATATVNVIGVVDQFLLRFEEDLRNGRVRTDSAADFDRLARLRELMSGSSVARIELQGGLTLEALQARHRAMRGQVAQITPQLAGTVEDSGPRGELDEDRQATHTARAPSSPGVDPPVNAPVAGVVDPQTARSCVEPPVNAPVAGVELVGAGAGSELVRAIDLRELRGGGR